MTMNGTNDGSARPVVFAVNCVQGAYILCTCDVCTV